MLIYRLLLLLKFVGVVLYGGGLVGALVATGSLERKRAVHAIASPGLVVTWTAGYLLTLQLNVALTEPWVLGGLSLSLVSQLALVAMATRERRTVVGALLAAVPFFCVLVLMIFRPRWPGVEP
ncbi:hypothetical protein [Corallococcus carmarthensis]|uniref:Uncharacterized protein n=1 Tax=Corallococcus carmarthensis TaxID=2316728 RepID=A0A3A8KE93_9BACT|nr:hypothetical protein [Corallococcus carmarthensis]NOK16313.1 hypothetical protein [Corallococcus carmarthensis]RKH06508.1 hypothetical protein D7X32_04820 [Corallococcus carmarthensis]